MCSERSCASVIYEKFTPSVFLLCRSGLKRLYASPLLGLPQGRGCARQLLLWGAVATATLGAYMGKGYAATRKAFPQLTFTVLSALLGAGYVSTLL